jgi:hypothetical protein
MIKRFGGFAPIIGSSTIKPEKMAIFYQTPWIRFNEQQATVFIVSSISRMDFGTSELLKQILRKRHL